MRLRDGEALRDSGSHYCRDLRTTGLARRADEIPTAGDLGDQSDQTATDATFKNLLWFSSKLALFKNPSFLPACRDNLQRCREADDERLEDFLGSRGAGADLAQCRRTHCGGYQASGCARLATGCSANRQANHRQVLTTSRCATCRPTCSAGAKGPDAAEDRLCEDAGPKPESRSSPNGLVWPQTGIDSTRALHIGECLCRLICAC